MQYFFLSSGINLLLMCDKNTELKISSSASSYLCCSFCVQTLQKCFQCFFLLGVTQQSWLLLTMILLGILVCILSFTCFFVYGEVLATQPVPAVPRSQGSVQQLWAAGTTCSWASPSLGGASLCAPWAWWSKAEVAEADTSVIPRITGLWPCYLCSGQGWRPTVSEDFPIFSSLLAPVKQFP